MVNIKHLIIAERNQLKILKKNYYMKTLVIFLNGVSVNTPFTFCNGFTLSKLSSLPDTVTLTQI